MICVWQEALVLPRQSMPSTVRSNQNSVLAGTVTKKATGLQIELLYIVLYVYEYFIQLIISW